MKGGLLDTRAVAARTGLRPGTLTSYRVRGGGPAFYRLGGRRVTRLTTLAAHTAAEIVRRVGPHGGGLPIGMNWAGRIPARLRGAERLARTAAALRLHGVSSVRGMTGFNSLAHGNLRKSVRHGRQGRQRECCKSASFQRHEPTRVRLSRHGYEAPQTRVGRPFRGACGGGMLDRMDIEKRVLPWAVNAGFHLAKGAVRAVPGCGAEASGLADPRHGSRHG